MALAQNFTICEEKKDCVTVVDGIVQGLHFVLHVAFIRLRVTALFNFLSNCTSRGSKSFVLAFSELQGMLIEGEITEQCWLAFFSGRDVS